MMILWFGGVRLGTSTDSGQDIRYGIDGGSDGGSGAKRHLCYNSQIASNHCLFMISFPFPSELLATEAALLWQSSHFDLA